MKRTWILGGAAWAVVLGCALGAQAQTTVDNVVSVGENLQQAITEAATRNVDTLVLDGPGSFPGPVSITEDLTIQGKDGVLGHEITITGGVTIDGESDVKLIGIGVNSTSTDGTASPAVLVMAGSSVSFTRCYIADSDVGVSVAGVGSSARFDSCSLPGNDSAISVQTGGKVSVVQCTFFDNGIGIEIIGGSASTYASLFDGNGVAVQANASVTASLQGNVINDPLAGVTQVGGLNPTAVQRSTDAEGWVGKLSAPISAAITNDDLPDGLSGGALDFEEDSRGDASLQAGADELGAAAGLVWIDCRIVTPFVALNGMAAVGLNTTARITVTLGPAAPTGVRQIYVKPQTGGLTGSDFIPVPLNPISAISPRTLVGDFTPQATVVNNLLLDGIATVYVVIDGAIYGVGENEALVAPVALSNSNFIIDTVPPQLVTPGNTPVPASFFIAASNDPDPTQSSGTVGGEGGGTAMQAKAFFNSQGSLSFSLQATFQDFAPNGRTDIAVSGLPPLGGGASGLVTVDDVIFPDGDPVPVAAPFWDRGFEGYGTFLSGSDPAEVSYSGGGTTLSAIWTFSGIPAVVAERNDWRIGPRFNAIDLAGNQARETDRKPAYFWWMLNAMARLTSFSYNYSVALNPIFSWDLVRIGDSPGRSTPADPKVFYRVWGSSNTENPIDGDWVDVSGWKGPYTQNTFEVDPTLLANDSVYMIAVRGFDEADNDQLSNPAANPVGSVNFDDAIINGAALEAALVSQYMPFVDFWRTPIAGQGQVETAVIPQFWHNVAGSSGYNDQIDAGEASFGGSRVIPFPTEPGVRVEAAFQVQVDVSSNSGNLGVRWELYEEGTKIDESGAFIPVPFAIVVPGPGLYTLGSAERSVNYTMRVTGSDGIETPSTPVEISDPTPVNIQFRVVPESELEKESGGIQPFKSFTRE